MNVLKTFLPVFAFFICFPAVGQYEIGTYNYNQTIVEYVKRDAEKVKKGKIQTRTVMQEEMGANGLPSCSKTYTQYTYNEQGLIKREDFYYGKKKLQRSVAYTYNEKNQVIQKATTFGMRKEPSFLIRLSYFNDSLISGLEFSRKGKTTYAYRYFYAPDGKIIEQRGYKKEKLVNRIEYDYYEDRSKKEVRYYEDSLKLEKTFRYDCGIGNSLLNEKQKDTLTRCSKTEDLGNGTIRTIDETRDEKGRIRRTITDSNKEQKWYEYRSYDARNRLTYSYRNETRPDGKNKTTTIFYKKGKEKQQLHALHWSDTFGFFTTQSFEKELLEDNYYSTYTFHSSIN
jgi:hypothetical protein